MRLSNRSQACNDVLRKWEAGMLIQTLFRSDQTYSHQNADCHHALCNRWNWPVNRCQRTGKLRERPQIADSHRFTQITIGMQGQFGVCEYSCAGRVAKMSKRIVSYHLAMPIDYAGLHCSPWRIEHLRTVVEADVLIGVSMRR